jgi:hypothetical protein
LSAGSYAANETTGALLFTLMRSGASTGAVSVSYGTADGTALAGADYVGASGTVSWADGDASIKSVAIALNNQSFSGTKTFHIQLSHPSASLAMSQTAAVATIVGGGSGPTLVSGSSMRSVHQWTSCDGASDDTAGLGKALAAAANHAFTLVIDCPVRFHTGSEIHTTLTVADGTTVVFKGDGILEMQNTGPTPLSIAHPDLVSLVDWNVNYL